MLDRLFLPETIAEALDADLAGGLRAIADALESGRLDGKHRGTMAAAGGRNDDRLHLRVTLDLAAPIVQRDADDVLESDKLLGERITLRSPHDMDSEQSRHLQGSITRGQEPETGV